MIPGATRRVDRETNGSREDLAARWAAVVAVRNAAPADCPCRGVTAPLVAGWEAFQDSPPGEDDPELDRQVARQWEALREAERAQAGGATDALPGEAVVDVRTREEFARSPRDGALNVPLDDLAGNLDGVARWVAGRPVAIFCASGMRAARAVDVLERHGVAARNGHEPIACAPGDPSCDPRATASEHRPDPHLGAADAADATGAANAASSASDNPFGRLLAAGGAAAGEAVAAATKAAVPAVSQAVQGEAPAVAKALGDAARAEVPPTVQAADAAARPAITQAAAQAGQAAGKAAGEAASQAWDPSTKLAVIGGGVAVAVGIVWLALRRPRR